MESEKVIPIVYPLAALAAVLFATSSESKPAKERNYDALLTPAAREGLIKLTKRNIERSR